MNKNNNCKIADRIINLKAICSPTCPYYQIPNKVLMSEGLFCAYQKSKTLGRISVTAKGTIITHIAGLRYCWNTYTNKWQVSKYQDELRNL